MPTRAFMASLAALAVLVVLPASAGAIEIGLADQKADMFYDSRFGELSVRHARLVVSWDMLDSEWETAQTDAWIAAARQAGVEPLIAFGHSRRPGRRRVLPLPDVFAYHFNRFRKRYPYVTNFASWNEANHCGEPTCHRVKMVARYFDQIRRGCVGCNVLAATLLDMPNLEAWAREFRRHAGVEPRYWGLHNYVDANRFRTSGTRALLRATKGEIWFTETGGIVERRTKVRIPMEESPQHAARATSWVFDRLVALSPRITRVYIYHWNAQSSLDNWDSALINRYGQTRPAYRIVQRELKQLSAARTR